MQRTPRRLIVSANGCPTEKISAFVDHFLNPLVKEMDSCVEDTSDFLRKIRDMGTISKNGVIGTMDVTSLYSPMSDRMIPQGYAENENNLKT